MAYLMLLIRKNKMEIFCYSIIHSARIHNLIIYILNSGSPDRTSCFLFSGIRKGIVLNLLFLLQLVVMHEKKYLPQTTEFENSVPDVIPRCVALIRLITC